jgi:RNA polymerase sigma-70 factor (ECF subfamily)
VAADDDALLQAWGEGDKSAAAELIERHSDELYRFFRGKVEVDEAEDLMQQTLLACLEQRAKREKIHSFRSFMFAVARRRLIDRLRRRGGASIDPTQVTIAALTQSPASKLARRQQERWVLEALRRIPIDSQIVLELYYWESLPGPELAAVLDIPEGTARGRIRKAKKLLGEELAQIADNPADLEETLTQLADWTPQR